MDAAVLSSNVIECRFSSTGQDSACAYGAETQCRAVCTFDCHTSVGGIGPVHFAPTISLLYAECVLYDECTDLLADKKTLPGHLTDGDF